MGKVYRDPDVALWRKRIGLITWTAHRSVAVDIIAYRSVDRVSYEGGPPKIQFYGSYLRIGYYVLHKPAVGGRQAEGRTLAGINIPLRMIKRLWLLLGEIVEMSEKELSGEETEWKDFVCDGPVSN